MRGIPGKLDNRYLLYSLLNPSKKAELLASARGSTVPRVLKTDITGLEIALPDIETQRTIGAFLETIDAKIDLNRRTNETLEAMARAIFRDWFVDFGPVRAKVEGQPAYLAPELWELFPDELDDDDKPEGWAIEQLSKVADRCGGRIRTGPFGSQLHKSDYQPMGTPVVMPTNLTAGSVVEDGIARVGDEMVRRLSDHAMTDGDIVYGRRGDIGRKALVGPDEEGWLCGTGCLRISIRSQECPSLYLFYHLDRPDVRDWISARAIGATMPNLNTTILGEVEVLLPSAPISNLFVSVVTPLVDKMRANRREQQTLRALRDALLPRLMTGEIRLKDVERAVEDVA